MESGPKQTVQNMSHCADLCRRSDAEFGRQYKAGSNPAILRVPTALPDGCTVSEEDVSGGFVSQYHLLNSAESQLLSGQLWQRALLLGMGSAVKKRAAAAHALVAVQKACKF